MNGQPTVSNLHSVQTVSVSGNGTAQVIVKAPFARAAKTYHIRQSPLDRSMWVAKDGKARFRQQNDGKFYLW